MNLPNKLTCLRVCMIPFFVVFMLGNFGPWQKWAALAFFVTAALTDALDGHIARSRKLITNFGKFMDPVADKLLVCSALICFVQTGAMPAWIVIIIVAREFIVSGFRLVASDQGIVLAAGIWGKLKTVCQMVMTVVLIMDIDMEAFRILGQILIYAALILTVISMVDYIWNNRQVLTNGGM